MSSLESFGKLLNETVAGEKLSASKVDRVRDSAAKDFHHTAKACSIILKVHRKSLPRTRLSSLYLFDGICRHAADIVRKNASGFDYQDAEPPSDSRARPGTKQALIDSASGFLYSASGIVEEIVLTTMQEVREDQKAKVTKVVDIWIKASTFDNGLLNDIKKKLSKPAQEDSSTSSSSNNNMPATFTKGNRISGQDAGRASGGESMESKYGTVMQESEQAKRTNTPPQVPSSLLALLGGGSKSGSDATLPNGDGPKAAALDAAQLAMLQQIAQNKGRQDATEPGNPPPSASAPTPKPVPSPPQRREPMPGPPPTIPKPASASTYPEARPHAVASPASAPAPVQATFVAPPPTTTPTSMETASFVPDPSIGDLSQFNFTLFDPTSALHWVRFAQHWHNTYQYVPSNQECLWAMMSAIQSQAYMAASYDNSTW